MLNKGKYLLLGTVLVYGVLVATHRGEFWPFSIYPMFSQAGHPWIRALVRKLPNNPNQVSWEIKTKKELPGEPFAMNKTGINQNDLANFIHKNKNWSSAQVNGLRKYFSGKLHDTGMLVFKVRGHASSEDPDSVVIQYIPYLYIKKDTTLLNPKLR